MEFSTSGGWTPSATRRNTGCNNSGISVFVEKFAVFVVLELKYLVELNCRVSVKLNTVSFFYYINFK